MIGKFAYSLNQSADLDGPQIAEVLWLSRYVTMPEPEAVTEQTAETDTSAAQPATTGQMPATTVPPAVPAQPPAPAQPAVYADAQRAAGATAAGAVAASKIRAPGVAALAGALEISRALRPFARRAESKHREVLDEAATVSLSAELSRKDNPLILPVMKPARERWFEVAVVVEDTPSMAVWREALAELVLLLGNHGAFRDVRLWRLSFDGDAPRLFSKGAELEARALNDASSRRLVLVASDCVSPRWRDGSAARLIAEWSATMPVVIGHVLSQRLWRRTALGEPTAEVKAAYPGAPNKDLAVAGVKWWDRTEARQQENKEARNASPAGNRIACPVISLDPKLIAGWARMVMSPGRRHRAALLSPEAQAPAAPKDKPKAAPTPEARLERYGKMVSPGAYRLAVVLSFLPLTLPVMRVAQRAAMPDTGHEELAEFLLGGLLKRKDPQAELEDHDHVQYQFHEGVRDLLRSELQPEEVRRLLPCISDFIGQRLHSIHDFIAWAADAQGEEQVQPDDLPFAEIGLDGLEQMGYPRRTIIKEFAPSGKAQPASTPPAAASPAAPQPDEGRGEETAAKPAESREAVESRLTEMRKEYDQLVAWIRGIEHEIDTRVIPSHSLLGRRREERRGLLRNIRGLEAELRGRDRGPQKTLDELIERAIRDLTKAGIEPGKNIESLVGQFRRIESQEVFDPQQAATLLNIANEFLRLGDPATAVEFCHFALERTMGDPSLDQHIFLELGQVYISMKEHSRAEESLRRALESAETAEDALGRARANYALGDLFIKQNNVRGAQEWYKDGLAQARAAKSIREQFNGLVKLAETHDWLMDFDDALACLNDALEIARSAEDRGRQAQALLLIGDLRLRMENPAEAREAYHPAMAIYIQLDDRHGEATAKERLAEAAEAAGQRKAAIKFTEQALEIFSDLASPDADRLRQTLERLRAQLDFSTFGYETLMLDARGKEVKGSRRTLSARQFTEELADGVAMEMVEIPGGTFLMGTAETDVEQVRKEYERYWGKESAERWVNRERPQHEATVSPFYIGKFTITQQQWRVVAGWPKIERDLDPEPSSFKGKPDSDRRPVERVSWDDAKEFCARLSQKTGGAYRLPTEAEWEYACRAGTTTPFAFGETITHEIANYHSEYPCAKAKKHKARTETVPVGNLPNSTAPVANAFGLFDMHGNVWEWCEDDWHDNYDGAPPDGSAWKSADISVRGSGRVFRGGGWVGSAVYCRSAIRDDFSPDSRNGYLGFRLART